MTTLLCTRDTICGGLLGLFLDAAGRVALTTVVSEGTDDVDELFLRHLVAMVADVGLAAVVFAVARASGKPSRVDRRLWRELSSRLASLPTELLDVVVVGESSSWSAAVSQRRRPRQAA
jgi:DNA repair protein RadC